jgi:2,5-diketo-D-gluconate reductase A
VATAPDVLLNNGVSMPQLGFGVWRVSAAETEEVVGRALEAGYRSIDTAAMYGNEEGVGRAVAGSGIPRDEVFVTSKLWNDQHGYDAALKAFDESHQRLGLDHIDLYLIHWPVPSLDLYVETFRALTRVLDDGRVRAVGVSNFEPEHLRRVIDEVGTTPAVNQVELHPYLQQGDLRAFHAEHGIATEGWRPLGRGGDLLREPVVATTAEKYGRTPAQVVLRWHLQLGNIVIPKSATPARIRENFDVFGFELADDDMAAFGELDRGTRLGMHPDEG